MSFKKKEGPSPTESEGDNNRQSFPLVVNDLLLKRIDEEIAKFQNRTGVRISKQQWIEAAIDEKIKTEKLNPPNSPLLKTKKRSLTLRLKKATVEHIRLQVDFLKHSSFGSYTNKQWILEAINEKICSDDS